MWPLPGHKHGKDPVDPAAPQNVWRQRSLPLRPAKTVDGFEPLGKMSYPEGFGGLRGSRSKRNYLAHGTVRGYTAPPVAELSKTKGSSKGVGIDPSPFDSIAENGDPPKGRRVALFKIGQRNLDRHGGLTAWSAEQEGSVGSVELYVLNPNSLMQIKKAEEELAEPSASMSGNPAQQIGGLKGITVSTGTDALSVTQTLASGQQLKKQASLGLSGDKRARLKREKKLESVIQSVHKKLARATALVTAQFNYADDILAKANNDPATPWRRRLSSMAASHTSGQQLAACSTTQTSTLSSLDTDQLSGRPLPGVKSRNWWRTVQLPADAMLVQPGGGMIGFFIREHAEGRDGGGVGATKLDLATSGGSETPAALNEKASSGSLQRRSVAVAGGSKVTRYVPVIRILTTPHELKPRGRWPFWNGRGWERSKHASFAAMYDARLVRGEADAADDEAGAPRALAASQVVRQPLLVHEQLGELWYALTARDHMEAAPAMSELQELCAGLPPTYRFRGAKPWAPPYRLRLLKLAWLYNALLLAFMLLLLFMNYFEFQAFVATDKFVPTFVAFLVLRPLQKPLAVMAKQLGLLLVHCGLQVCCVGTTSRRRRRNAFCYKIWCNLICCRVGRKYGQRFARDDRDHSRPLSRKARLARERANRFKLVNSAFNAPGGGSGNMAGLNPSRASITLADDIRLQMAVMEPSTVPKPIGPRARSPTARRRGAPRWRRRPARRRPGVGLVLRRRGGDDGVVEAGVRGGGSAAAARAEVRDARKRGGGGGRRADERAGVRDVPRRGGGGGGGGRGPRGRARRASRRGDGGGGCRGEKRR